MNETYIEYGSLWVTGSRIQSRDGASYGSALLHETTAAYTTRYHEPWLAALALVGALVAARGLLQAVIGLLEGHSLASAMRELDGWAGVGLVVGVAALVAYLATRRVDLVVTCRGTARFRTAVRGHEQGLAEAFIDGLEEAKLRWERERLTPAGSIQAPAPQKSEGG